MIPQRRLRLTVGNPQSGNGFVVENLKVDFEIEKFAAGAPNIATIRIYNLSSDSYNQLQERYTKCILEYGTGPVLSVLFIGDIYNVITAKNNGIDVVTTLYCGSGLEAYKKGTVHQTFPANEALEDLVKTVASKLKDYGVTLGVFDEGLPDKLSEGRRGIALSGSVATILDNLLKGTGFTYSIDNDQINVEKQITQTTTDIYVTPANGLIGSVKRTQAGFDFTSILNPQLTTGITVAVYSEFTEFSGTYLNYMNVKHDTGGLVRIISLVHNGSNYDGNATTTAVGVK